MKNTHDPGPIHQGDPPVFFNVSALIVALTAIPYVLMWKLSRVREFDPDEFEHLHAAWCFFKGMIPYRDFFEHHTPGLYFLVAPLFHLFQVDTNPEDAVRFLFFSRTLMWFLTGIILAVTFWVGKTWRDRETGVLSMFFLINTVMVIEKCLETRPDHLSTIFWLACLGFALHGVNVANAPDAKWFFAWSGFFLGAGLMFSQKLLMASPGLCLTALWYVFDGRLKGTFIEKLINCGRFLFGLSVPVACVLAFFAFHGSLSQFMELNLFLNLGWAFRFIPYIHLRQLAEQNPVLVVLALSGSILTLTSLFRDTARRGDFVILLNFIGLIAGLFLIPVSRRQYFLMFLPLGALFASNCLTHFLNEIPHKGDIGDRRNRGAIVTVCSISILLWIAIKLFNISVNESPVFTLFICVTPLAVLLHIYFHSTKWAISLLLLGLSAHSVKQISSASRWTNFETLRHVRFIHENTLSTDTVMEGWKGFGVFRPHAYYYYFLHDEIRAMLTEDQRRRLEADLETGRIRPALVVFDENMRGISPGISRFFLDRYAPVFGSLVRARVMGDRDKKR